MQLWLIWWGVVVQLRPAFSYAQTFLWFCTCLAGMTIRRDNAGVTSFIRALGLHGFYYDRMLDFFHSSAVNRDLLTQLWTKVVISFGLCHTTNGRLLLIADGIKAPKEGKKMPAVKSLHQESDSNSKPEFIMGHSCQALALCCRALSSFFAIPLAVQIHEGIVLSNRDRKTLMDKMNGLVSLVAIEVPLYFLGDRYYAVKKIALFLVQRGNHLITRVRSNAVAFLPPPQPRSTRRGRPKKYGKKIKLRNLFRNHQAFTQAQSPLPEEQGITISYRSHDLLWKPVAMLVRFVLVIHPKHGKTIYMTTDLGLSPLEVISTYALRFKIELSFRHAIHVIGTYAYHFWMMPMTPIRRRSGNQHLHKKTQSYRDQVARKINAYHLHLQLGVITQGILNYIASIAPNAVWSCFRSWIRTIRPGIAPSEAVTATALRNSFPEFLLNTSPASILTKFIASRIDPRQNASLQLGIG